MRTLLVRMTVIAATLAAFFAGLLAAATQASWVIVLLRALVAFAVVTAVGFGVGAVLMRTAIRRYYEQFHAEESSRRARENR